VSTNAPAVTLANRYELGAMIGRGGMSQVWRARDTRLERDVAVKILHPGLSSLPLNRERFEREALAAARVSHPNVVAVYDAGEQDGELFIVMECLPGNTLYEEMARGPVGVERARTIALQLLRGLGAAHALGIVHRDIKPGNVLFAADGTAKLADFGIAKFTEAADLTKTGQMVGTAQYLPPERLMGNDATASGDLYSLGVVLYEALAGRRPFDGDTPLALVRAIESSTPTPIGEVRADVDAGFARAIDGATAKDPRQRFESAAAMSAALIGPPPTSSMPATEAFAPPTAPTALMPAMAATAAAAVTTVEPVSAEIMGMTPAATPTGSPVGATAMAPPPPRARSAAWLVGVALACALAAMVAFAVIAAALGARSDRPVDTPSTTVPAPVTSTPVSVAPTTAAPTTVAPAPTTAAPVAPVAPVVPPKGKGKGKG
jgi:hypothetical protein